MPSPPPSCPATAHLSIVAPLVLIILPAARPLAIVGGAASAGAPRPWIQLSVQLPSKGLVICGV